MGRQRKLPSGLWQRDRTYYARLRVSGREIRKRLSTDFDAACEMLNHLRARADRADFGLLDNDYPYSTLKAEFLKGARQTLRNPEDYEQDLATFEAYTSIMSIAQINPELIIGYRDWRLSGGGSRQEGKIVTARTINRQVGTIHNMLNKGVEWKRIASNRLAGLKPLPHDQLAKDRRALSVDEVLAILDASPEHLRPVWRMFMCSGIRHNELVAMTFADVDFERRTVTVRAATSKNHKAREIPLDDALLATICQLRHAAKHRQPGIGLTDAVTAKIKARFSREHVFVTKASTPWRNHLLERFYAVCRKAGIEGAKSGGSVDIHSLRVSFATLSLEHGANPKDVQAILGHGTLKMTMDIYSKATERGKRAVINLLPFASASSPAYSIPVQKAHAVRTSSPEMAQAQAS